MAVLKKFSRIPSDDRVLNQLQDSIQNSINPIASLALVNGNFIQGVSLLSGTVNIISHGLGRNYISYIVLSKSAYCDIYVDSTNEVKDKTLNLVSNANATIDLWIF